MFTYHAVVLHDCASFSARLRFINQISVWKQFYETSREGLHLFICTYPRDINKVAYEMRRKLAQWVGNVWGESRPKRGDITKRYEICWN